MSRVIHFEVPAEDPARAMAFFEKVFGWRFPPFDALPNYWGCITGPDDQPGINGGLMKRFSEGQPVVATIQVDSIDDTIATITEHGGHVVVEKMPIPGIGELAYFKDTEGNIFGVCQFLSS